MTSSPVLVAQYIKSSRDANFVDNSHDNVSLFQGFFIVCPDFIETFFLAFIYMKEQKDIACDTKIFLSFQYLFPSAIETLSSFYKENLSVSKREFNIEKLFRIWKQREHWKMIKISFKTASCSDVAWVFVAWGKITILRGIFWQFIVILGVNHPPPLYLCIWLNVVG